MMEQEMYEKVGNSPETTLSFFSKPTVLHTYAGENSIIACCDQTKTFDQQSISEVLKF
jgi:hypothetical protein